MGHLNGLRRRALLAWLGAGVLAAGCSLPKQRYTQQAGFWRGRIAVHTEEDPPQSHVAAFELRGSAQEGQLDAFSPLGSVLARLRWDAEHAQLEDGRHTYTSDTLDDLAARIFGAPIPVQALFAWLSGDAQVAPGWQVDLSQFEYGRISALREQPLPRATLRVILESQDGSEAVTSKR